MHLYTSQGKLRQIEDAPFGRGGEGNIHRMLLAENGTNQVVKLYHPHERKPQKAKKIAHMVAHPPALSDPEAIAWPAELLYDEQGNFVGFQMPLARGAYDLTVLSALKLPTRLEWTWHERYDRRQVRNLSHRARVCYHLAHTVGELHASQNYVLADLKPENIKVQYDGRVSLLDLDSLEIIRAGQMLFPAQKVTAEYSPAEFKGFNWQKNLIPASWDNFSLAVVFYKILFGLHPYTGTTQDQYRKLISHEDKIQAGILPLGAKADCFRVIPLPHQNFQALPSEIQGLFLRCFEQGHDQPEVRPKASEWAEAWQDFQPKAHNYYSPYPSKPRSAVQPKVKSMPSRPPVSHYLAWLAMAVSVLILMFFGSQTHFGYFDSYQHAPSSLYDLEDVMDIKIHDFSEKIAPFWSYPDAKYGFIDQRGNMITNARYSFVRSFKQGRAAVSEADKWGFLDQTGSEIVPLIYEKVSDFDQGYAVVNQLGQVGLINLDGEMVLEAEFDEIKIFSQSLIGLKKEGKYALYSGNRPISPFVYEEVQELDKSFVRVSMTGQYGLVHKSGYTLVPPRYEKIAPFHDGLALVQLNGKKGYIQQSGEVVIPIIYDYAADFTNRQAAVTLAEKDYYIDPWGNCVKNCAP